MYCVLNVLCLVFRFVQDEELATSRCFDEYKIKILALDHRIKDKKKRVKICPVTFKKQKQFFFFVEHCWCNFR